MAKFVLVYKGGKMGATAAEQQAAMEAWMKWSGALGAAVVDAGNPFGASSSIARDGTTAKGARSALTGYSIIEAKSMSEATKKAKRCLAAAESTSTRRCRSAESIGTDTAKNVATASARSRGHPTVAPSWDVARTPSSRRCASTRSRPDSALAHSRQVDLLLAGGRALIGHYVNLKLGRCTDTLPA